MINKLFFSINEFVKLSGLLKTPSQALNYITSKTLKETCSIMLGLIEKEEIKKTKYSFDKLKQVCLNYASSSKIMPSDKSESFFVDIDFSSMPYFDSSKDCGIMIDVELIYDDKIRSNIVPGLSSWSGLWYNKTIYVYIGNLEKYLFSNINYFIEKLEDIKDTIRHELQHSVQTFINEIKNIQAKQLPSKVLKEEISTLPFYEKHLEEKQKEGEISEQRKEMLKSELSQKLKLISGLEFYPALEDNISWFKRVLNNYDEKLKTLKIQPNIQSKIKNLLFKAWVNQIHAIDFVEKITQLIKTVSKQNKDLFNKLEYELLPTNIIDALNRNEENELFSLIKQYQPEKYKKALKEFYKEIGQHI